MLSSTSWSYSATCSRVRPAPSSIAHRGQLEAYPPALLWLAAALIFLLPSPAQPSLLTMPSHLGVPALATALFKNSDPYRHFLPLLAHSNDPEDPIPLLTSTVLATLMAQSRDESPSTERALPLILSYLCTLAKNSADAGKQDIAVTEYSSLLYGTASRQLFWKQRSETVAPLVDILRKAAGIGEDSSASLWSGNSTTRSANFEGALGGGVGLQLLYHVLLVMWQLSFEAEDIGDEMDEYGYPSMQVASHPWTDAFTVNTT